MLVTKIPFFFLKLKPFKVRFSVDCNTTLINKGDHYFNMAITWACKLVFCTQMLHIGNIIYLPRLSSYPSQRFLYSPINYGNMLETICPTCSAWGQDGLVWVLLLTEAEGDPLLHAVASWSGASVFLELENIQAGRTLEILYLVHTFHFTHEDTETQINEVHNQLIKTGTWSLEFKSCCLGHAKGKKNPEKVGRPKWSTICILLRLSLENQIPKTTPQLKASEMRSDLVLYSNP